MNSSGIYSNMNLFNLNEINKKPFCLSCKNCHNSPNVFIKDNDDLIIECIHCSVKKEEKISKIFNCSSEWMTNRIIIFCNLEHKSAVISKIYCKTCNLFLCQECLDLHQKENCQPHEYINIDKLKLDICNYHQSSFFYYCKECDTEFCQKCLVNHYRHKFLEFGAIKNDDKSFNEIINLKSFQRFLEITKNIQKDKYNFTYEIVTCLQNLITDNQESINLLNAIILEILRLFCKDLKIIQNLIFLSKILFFTLKQNLKKNPLVENYRIALNYINTYFQKDEIEKYKKSIFSLKEEYEKLYIKLIQAKLESKDEKERLENMKRELLQRQKKMREELKIKQDSTQNNYSDFSNEEKINVLLEDMCIYGNIMEKEIQKEKKENPEKFIETNEALKLEKEDPDLFILGLLSNNLEKEGLETVIEKEDHEDKEEAGITSLQFFTSGLYKKERYDLHFDLGEERNEELLTNKSEYEKFKFNLKLKLSKDYNIPVDKIIVTFPQKGSFHVQVIFQSNDFNNLNEKKFLEKFKNDDEFEEMKNIKEIHSDVILKVFKMTRKWLDKRGNRVDGWGINEKRGNKPYYPPIGWVGIGLNVMDKYDKGNNTWLGYDGSNGEWCVAYHGVGRGQSSDKIKKIIGEIYKDKFKAGDNQYHSEHEDMFHKGKKVGYGVYCTPFIETANDFSGVSEIKGKNYKTVLMVRVKPNAIRSCEDQSDYWVVNGTNDEIRPYRILYKSV